MTDEPHRHGCSFDLTILAAYHAAAEDGTDQKGRLADAHKDESFDAAVRWWYLAHKRCYRMQSKILHLERKRSRRSDLAMLARGLLVCHKRHLLAVSHSQNLSFGRTLDNLRRPHH